MAAMSCWWPPLGFDVALRLEPTSGPSLLLGLKPPAGLGISTG